MDSFSKSLLEGDVKFAMTLHTFAKQTKYLLALVLLTAYFSASDWLIDILVFSVVFSLVLPLGFFAVFIQKLLEYNTQMVESRMILNANEANETFTKVFEKLK